MKLLFKLGCASGCLAISMGALGNHKFRKISTNPEFSYYWNRAQFYHITHALAMVGTAAMGRALNTKVLILSNSLFLVGTAFFAGSLYYKAVKNETNMIMPVGGMCLILGWAVLLLS